MNQIKGTKDDKVMKGIIHLYKQRGIRAKELPPITEKYMGDNWQLKEMADISMDQGTYGPWELPKGSL